MPVVRKIKTSSVLKGKITSKKSSSVKPKALKATPAKRGPKPKYFVSKPLKYQKYSSPVRRPLGRRAAQQGTYSESTVAKPYKGSVYNNDFFCKIEEVGQIATFDAVGTCYSTVRSIPARQNFNGNSFVTNQPEFRTFNSRFANWEIVGIKSEIVLNANYIWSGALMGAGLTPSFAANRLGEPDYEFIKSLPIVKDMDCNATIASIYYPYSKDLKNMGAQFGNPQWFTGASPTPTQLSTQGSILFRGVALNLDQSPIQQGQPTGNYKYTWYLRFHGTSSNQGQVGNITPPKPILPKLDLNELKYEELQIIKEMMAKRLSV